MLSIPAPSKHPDDNYKILLLSCSGLANKNSDEEQNLSISLCRTGGVDNSLFSLWEG